jgi:carbonic anhydrase
MKATKILLLPLILIAFMVLSSVKANWQEWWTYDGISGPGYWGVINPAWTLCSRGRHQSPINIDPSLLVRDLTLDESPKFAVDKRPTSGNLYNTGQALVFRVDPDRAAQMPVNITGGPLSYR